MAIVGSRNPTHYGIKTAESLAAGLAIRGVGVVSGLARGIDSAAHRGCLRGKGFTIAVMGTGIDTVYPASNSRLSETALKLVSKLQLKELITHVYDFEDGAKAYQMVDEHPEEVLFAVLKY